MASLPDRATWVSGTGPDRFDFKTFHRNSIQRAHYDGVRTAGVFHVGDLERAHGLGLTGRVTLMHEL